MMMQSTSNLNQQERNWLDLPTDVTTNILNRIGTVDILENVQKVCTDWYKICKGPSLWRVINMNDLPNSASKVKSIFKNVVNRSQGQLVDITIVNDHNGELFHYAADRSSQLRRLEVAFRKSVGSLTTDALMKFPLLEELNLYAVDISKEEIETLGCYCPMLKTLKLNERNGLFMIDRVDEDQIKYFNEKAIAIGKNLLELRHLELNGNRMTNIGLQVILDNCHHLETLDLRACFNIDIKGDLGRKCYKKIKHLKLPDDSLEGSPYYYDLDSESDDECLCGCDDSDSESDSDSDD